MKASIMYNSKFLGSETRQNIQNTDSGIYVSRLADDVVIDDIFISPNAIMELDTIAHSNHIILPLVGTLITPDERYLQPDELLLLPGTINKVSITNPQQEGVANFLHISFNSDAKFRLSAQPGLHHLELTTKNQLVTAAGNATFIKVGIYDSRVKDSVSITDNSVVIYVINGSFEVEGRLMEHRDSLQLWDVQHIDIEALSEAAIILLIEYSH